MNNSYDVVNIVREFLRIDTSNPPGNEEEAVLYIENILRNNNMDCTIYSPAPKRANLMARLPGKTKGKAIIFLSHIDVVPARVEEWDVNPFGGEIINGFLYGRGAIDMKTQAICQLLAFIQYQEEGLTPERDIILLVTGDEEAGGAYGVEYMLAKEPSLKDASFVLSEGGFIKDDGVFTHAQISVSEKKLSQFTIKAKGTGGHGSIPHHDSANEKVIRACSKILAYQWPIKITPIVSAYLNGIFKENSIGGQNFKNLRESLHNKQFQRFLDRTPLYNALLRNTVTPTVLRGGDKVNVIPTESSIQFDARLLPGENPGSFMKKIARLSGPEVEIVPIGNVENDPSSIDYKGAFFAGIRSVTRKLKGKGFPVLPYITTGASDLRFFRNLGIPAYGFFPITLTNDEFLRMHSKNERISIDNIREGLTGTEQIVKFLGSLKVV